MLRKVYIPKISIFKTFWRHLKPCHTMPKSNNDASCNFSSMNPLQSRILFLLSEERNKCNVCFPSTIFLCCLVCWCFQRLKERFVQIYRDFISIENTSYRDFAKYWYWHVLRFDKENCEGRSSLGFSQDGAGGFFPEIVKSYLKRLPKIFGFGHL